MCEGDIPKMLIVACAMWALAAVKSDWLLSDSYSPKMSTHDLNRMIV